MEWIIMLPPEDVEDDDWLYIAKLIGYCIRLGYSFALGCTYDLCVH